MNDERDGRQPDLIHDFGHSLLDPRAVRHAVREALGTNEFATSDVTLVASELVTNVVEHTDDGGQVRLWTGDPLLLEVEDSEPKVPTISMSPDEGGGRGLSIVARLTEQWGIRGTATGKTIWASFRRHRQPPP